MIHGFRTVYPISIAQACSWNPALVEKACAMAAREHLIIIIMRNFNRDTTASIK